MEGGTSVTAIHPELSPKSRYWIDRHRYYELKHFCLQYPLWIRARASLDGLSRRALRLTPPSPTGLVQSPTSRCAEQRLWYTERIAMVEESAAEADPLAGRDGGPVLRLPEGPAGTPLLPGSLLRKLPQVLLVAQ